MLEAIIAQYGIPAFGVSLVLLLVWLAGGRRNLTIGEAQVRKILTIEGYPPPDAMALSSAGDCALVTVHGQHLLIRSQGDYWASASLDLADGSARLGTRDASILRIHFSSPGQRDAVIRLNDADTCEDWYRRLQAHTADNA